MITHDYSQLPVIDNGIVKGSITERTLIMLDPLLKGKKIGEVMESKFSVVSADTKLETIKHMLADFQAVLVDKGEGQRSIFLPQTVTIGLTCGIDTGNAIVGNFGSKLRDQFTALGIVVNPSGKNNDISCYQLPFKCRSL